jgi:acyl-coenzyme A thioesterase PaaI-like protein
VHGGVLPLLFDSVFGMVIHAAGRPISRTTARGWVRESEGRKAFVNAELRDSSDPDANLLAEANGLMIRLLPGQP